MEDEEYLNILHKNLKELNKNKYDFVFYVAGVDIHFEDRLGKLKITDDGINKRDQIVIENFYSRKTPLCGVLGGGSPDNTTSVSLVVENGVSSLERRSR